MKDEPDRFRVWYEKGIDVSFARHQLGQPAAVILDAMVWLESGRIPMPWHRSLVAYASGHLPRAGAFKGYTAKLKACELVSFPDAGGLALEHDGRVLALEPAEPFDRADYWQLMDGHLGMVERAIVGVIREDEDAFEPWRRESLVEAVCSRLADGRADLRAATAKLLAVGLLDLIDGEYQATQVLYPRSVFEIRRAGLTGPDVDA